MCLFLNVWRLYIKRVKRTWVSFTIMSLLLPLSDSQFHSKPMAISSITSPTDPTRSTEYRPGSPSPSSSSSQSGTVSPPTSSTNSESQSPPAHSFFNHTHAPSYSYPLIGSSKSDNKASSSFYYSYGNEGKDPASLSLQERRLRNKTASAKYRAKKNQQHCEMRSMIATLTKENELLMRQLDHVKHENTHLKATCDKLRGKMIAQKMLKQYLVESEQRLKTGE